MSDPTLPTDADRALAFSDLSHEVRGVIGGATLSAHTMSLARNDEERAKTAEALQGAMRRMTRLADDLHDVARILAARPPGERTEHDLVHAARRISAGLAADAVLRKVDFSLESEGLPAHVVVGEPLSWDRTLERLLLAGLETCPRHQKVTPSLALRDGRLELAVPCGNLPPLPDGDLFAAWGEARRREAMFPRGVWLARAFLVAEGGGLTIDGEPGARRVVAVFPPARPG